MKLLILAPIKFLDVPASIAAAREAGKLADFHALQDVGDAAVLGQGESESAPENEVCPIAIA